MKKVITYGTFDLLHYGHIKLLERAKELGDYLIVGVTSEDFDKKRGKINVQQTLMERVKGVKETGLADEIVIEEYEGQKIDDICRYGIDIFVLGSDWEGKFDYLRKYCEVVYLPRTEGISSSEIRAKNRKIKLGVVGEEIYLKKIINESVFVNGIELGDICTDDDKYEELLQNVDAVYLISHPSKHYKQIKTALMMKKNVLCESPITLSKEETQELYKLANEKECILMESIKTAYATAYLRLLLLLQGGIIGKIISVDATCTSLKTIDKEDTDKSWNSICAWGPTALLPIFQILGVHYKKKEIISRILSETNGNFDLFTKINFVYEDAVASLKVGKGVKSEGNLIITGTKGYIYIPAPWWKTDYFEVRYEDQRENKRYFYQLDGEGIRYELLAFTRSIQEKRMQSHIEENVTYAISQVMEDFEKKIDFMEI